MTNSDKTPLNSKSETMKNNDLLPYTDETHVFGMAYKHPGDTDVFYPRKLEESDGWLSGFYLNDPYGRGMNDQWWPNLVRAPEHDLVRRADTVSIPADRQKAFEAWMASCETADDDGVTCVFTHEEARLIQNAISVPSVTPDWQPIETAPKDGTILVCQYRNKIIKTATWSEYHMHWSTGASPMDFLAETTHWMPLPNPPKTPNAETQESIRNAREGKNLTRYGSLDDLMKETE